MSLRNRARKLMRETGLTYQQALNKLRALGKARSDEALALAPAAPKIEVITVEPRSRGELACQQLLHTTSARAVLLVDKWRVLASAGAKTGAARFNKMLVVGPDRRLPKQRKTIDLRGAGSALMVPIKRLHLIVVYDDSVSILLLEKRVEKAVEYLESLIDDDPLLAPPSADEGGGDSGLPSVAWNPVEIWKKKP